MQSVANIQKRKKERFLRLGGKLGSLVQNIIDRWLIDIRETNPAILDMFHDAGHRPYRHLLAWSGEFAGKYLTCSCQLLNMTHDDRLRKSLEKFVAELLSCQGSDGYLGPFSKEHQLTGTVEPTGYCFDSRFKPESFDTWDAWGHYHIMIGLMLWYDISNDADVLECVTRIADLFCGRFYKEGKPRLHSIGSQEMNLAPIHSFAMLYRMTGERKYLDFALEVLKDFEIPPAGDYLRQALDNKEFFEMPKPRWESLHAVQGIVELYRITGEESYRQAAYNIWKSITKTDIHNTGGFTTGEQATGCPYDEGPIETCCTIAYMALTADILEITGDTVAADMLEICTFNSGMGSFSPSGRWSTYDTPMAGYKRANYDSIHFQCRPGSPDLNCCSVNAPRAFGLLDVWGYSASGRDVNINFYAEQTARVPFDGGAVTISQTTDYPYDGKILIRIDTAPDSSFLNLRLRVPFWSKRYTLLLNGESAGYSFKNGYAAIERKWNNGDILELNLDMEPHIWAGEGRLAGQGALYRGPLLLCFDPFYDRDNDILKLPIIEADSLRLLRKDINSVPGGLFTFEWDNYDDTSRNREIVLCDLYTAGSTGSPYTSWLPMKGLLAQEYSTANPIRSRRYGEYKEGSNP